ncbi:YchE family NAAT transporter [Pontiellaceae bacterium B1224]|nr:YchE family NAAT transporter [Pontiellaceae bacterium B1224]
MNEWTEYLKFLAAVTSVANPIGLIPIFVTLTVACTKRERQSIARQTCLAFACVLIITLFAGEPLLGFFGITVASFKTAGGIIILLMAISMVHAKVSPAKQTKEEAVDAIDKKTIAIVPLCIPLLAGPGSISTVIVYSQHSYSIVHFLLLTVEIIVIALIVWICLSSAHFIAKLLGQTGINVITRIMGLVLAAIGVEFITHGIMEIFPVLAP